MTRSKSPGNVPGADVVDYYRRRSEGGVGLIVTEGTPPGFTGAHGYPDVPSFYGEMALAGWKRVADAVHQTGGFIIPQIWHVGSVRKKGLGPDPDEPIVGPSAVMHPLHLVQGTPPAGAEIPEAMTQDEISSCVSAYAQSARDAVATASEHAQVEALGADHALHALHQPGERGLDPQRHHRHPKHVDQPSLGLPFKAYSLDCVYKVYRDHSGN